jgi:hypothetical protein
MRTEHYIGLDTHCVEAEMAVVTTSGRLSKRWRKETAIALLREAIESVPTSWWSANRGATP